MRGTIVKIISNLYTVETEQGRKECRARGRFRKDLLTPLVGDQCLIDEKQNYILEIFPRKNFLSRPTIANVDVALIVTSVKKPNLSLNLLDKMISVVTIHQIQPVLCFTKLDLLSKLEKKEIKSVSNYYKKLGISVITNQEYKKLNKILKQKMVVVTGQTGAGKSTLLNKLNKNLHLRTDEISESLGRGKHTTRHVELFSIRNFYIADTPGFSSLDLNQITKEEIRDSFIEFQNFTCPFNNCMHDKEKNCQVKIAVENGKILKSRYENYLNFIKNR